MVVEKLITFLIAAVGGIVALFGWSHKGINKKIEDMEKELLKRPTDDKVRLIVTDKLAPHVVEYRALSRRLDELNRHQYELSKKLDKVIELCSKIK